MCFTLFSNEPNTIFGRLNALADSWPEDAIWEDAVVLAGRQLKNWVAEGPGGQLARARQEQWVHVMRELLGRR